LVVGERATGTLLGLGRGIALVELAPNRVVVLLCAGRPLASLAEELAGILERGRGVNLDLVMIGGGVDARTLIERAQPRLMLRRFVRAYHLEESGTVWVGRSTRRDSAVGDALTAVARGEGPADVQPEQLEQQLAVPSEDQRAEAREHQAFLEAFRARRPIATWSLLVILVTIFGLQALWGGTELVPTLVRMGANTPAVFEGEPWRLLSSAFLHAGPWHLLVNAYVLFALGGFVERLIGWPRFVLLYGLAALGGGLASAWLQDAGISVGASGAIWGVFGAAGALAWRPEGVLPQRVIPRMRRVTAVNLAINLTVSFLPQVDLMAHLGGGIVGAGLVVSGLLTRGLPSIGQADEADQGERGSRVLVASATLVAAVLIGSIAVGWVAARPWDLGAEPRWSRQVLEPGVPIELPEELGPPSRVGGRPGEASWRVGDLGRDPLAIVITITPVVGADDVTEATGALRERPLAPPDGARRVGERTHPDIPGVAWEERFTMAGGLLAVYRLVRLENAEVFLEVAWWQDAPEPWNAEVVDRVLGSVHASP
jgi:rhomboid protease GluP